jgi:hypothetical protein
MPLRHGEGYVNRSQLRNGDQGNRGRQLSRFDEISFLEGDRSRPAADWRQNCRIIQIHAGIFDRGLGRAHGGFENRQAGLYVLELLRRREPRFASPL